MQHSERATARTRPNVPGIIGVLGMIVALCMATACTSSGPASPSASASRPVAATPVTPVTPAPDTVVVDRDGRALAPRSAPEAVRTMIDAANRIVGLPYRFGGGHRPYREVPVDSVYDGSGATSFVLHAAGLLDEPRSAEQLRTFGKPGRGKWVTILVCSNGAHMVIAGMAFDTHREWGASDDHPVARWRQPYGGAGCFVRHPAGL